MVLICFVSATALSPDLSDLRLQPTVTQRGGERAGRRWLTSRLLIETELIQTADIVVVGEVVNSPKAWTMMGSTKVFKPLRFDVVLAVDRYIIGDCGDTLRFWQQRLDLKYSRVFSPDLMTYDTEYSRAETVLVLLYGNCEELHTSGYSGRSYKYLVEGGAVTRKGLHLEEFIGELEAAREVEPVRYPYPYGASPN